MSKLSNRRDVNGVLLLDKPAGMSSNSALQTAKNHFNAQKAGHTGILDPLASGMLPLCFGEATKFSQFLLEADKSYHVIARLGIKTTTGDTEGEILEERNFDKISPEVIANVLLSAHGSIEQTPPMYSAIKYQGQPLYHYARKGIDIERKRRKVQIYKINLLSYEEKNLTLAVHCSKGTYIRTLIEDIGEKLNCGAHVIGLRRLSIGHLLSEQMITMSQLADNAPASLDKFLLPVDCMLMHLPELIISEAGMFYLRRGQAIISPYAPDSGLVRLKTKSKNFLGMGEILNDGRVAPRRLVATSAFL